MNPGPLFIMIFRPLLAAAIARPKDSEEELERKLKKLRLPVLATPKFDGIRITTIDIPPSPDALSVPVCRSLLQVPNNHVRGLLSQLAPGFDGEGMTYQQRDLFCVPKFKTFHQIQSDLMTEIGIPDFKFHVFGCHVTQHQNLRYRDMIRCLEDWNAPDFVVKILPVKCETIDELKEYFGKCIAEGYEGICFRIPDAENWKVTSMDGRSTLSEQWLVKWKLFEESEAEIIGFEEEMHNANEAVRDLRGLQARSSHQANMVGKNRLGAFWVQKDGIKFKVGIGFTDAMREEFWSRREELMQGWMVSYKHQPYGAKEAPRIAVFRGLRNKIDMS